MTNNIPSARLLAPEKAVSFWHRLRQRNVLYYLIRFIRRPLFSLAVIRERWYEANNPDLPMLARDVLPFLEERLDDSQVGLEWGSGGSTTWFAERCKSLVSIEDISAWHARVEQKLKEGAHENVDLRLVSLDRSGKSPGLEGFPNYVLEANRFENESFDFCLIDGRYRQACVLMALPKIKPGGLLIVDDSNGMAQSEWGVEKDWPVVLEASTGLKKTTVWRRPNKPR